MVKEHVFGTMVIDTKAFGKWDSSTDLALNNLQMAIPILAITLTVNLMETVNLYGQMELFTLVSFITIRNKAMVYGRVIVKTRNLTLTKVDTKMTLSLDMVFING